MLITTKENYVLIKSAKMPVDKETKFSKPQKNYQDERSRLQQLIMMSIQNPKQMETYVTQFLDQKHTLSNSFQQTRARVSSQPQLESKAKPFCYQKPLQNPYISRRCSKISRVDTSPKSPTRTPSTNSRCLPHSFAETEKKMPHNTPISKLSTSALIDYHKKLVHKAQKILGSNKKKQ